MSLGIYVHVPFCRRKCVYCDFFSVGERLADWPRLAGAIAAELRMRTSEIEKTDDFTIYFGGGTPSLMPLPLISSLLSEIRQMVLQRNPDARFSEITIEVNPDDVTPELAAGWRMAGFTRVSMGVQSLDDNELKSIGRRHDSLRAREAYSILRRHFDNISLDLMFGLPGQTLLSLEKTLQGFIEMRPEHISAYSLMYEERTALTRMRDSGKIVETDEESSVEMFGLISRRLKYAGYARYEISNYSLPGMESQHNSAYWRGYPYIGLGPSAHSYDGRNLRSANIADIGGYIAGIEKGERDYMEESLSDDELSEEMIMTRMRNAEGLNLMEFECRFGVPIREKLLRSAERNLRLGNLEIADGFLRLTDQGVMISDDILSDMF